MTKPGDYVICVDADHGLKNGETYHVRDVDGYGRFHIGGIDGPLNPERFKPAPSYEQLLQQRDKIVSENDKLRASLANGSGPCVYCDLPASEMVKCPLGFPGCDRADDMMLCPHFGAGMREAQLQQHRDELLAALTKASSLLGGIVESDGVDAGVIYLSSDSPTHKEMHLVNGRERTISVYDHEYFSPLGDALVGLAKHVKAAIASVTGGVTQ